MDSGVLEDRAEEEEEMVVVVAKVDHITRRKAIKMHQVVMIKVTFSAIIAKSSGIMKLNVKTHERNEITKAIWYKSITTTSQPCCYQH